MNAANSPTAGTRTGVVKVVLAVIPWVGMLVLIPFVNRVEPFVLGMPFLMFWIVLWVVLTSVCMGIVYAIDPVNRKEAQR